MSTRMTMGVACVVAMAAFAAGPAAAAPLTDFAGTLHTGYDHSSPGGGNQWFVGGAAAGPLGAPNLNFQVDVLFSDTWLSGLSQRSGSVGGALFWAGADGRIGIRGEYNSVSHAGSAGLGIAFAEGYFGIITGMIKGGYVSTTGSGFGGRGGMVGAGAAIYVMPNLAITPAIEYANIVSGQGCQICGRGSESIMSPSVTAEFLLADALGPVLPIGALSVFGGYAYNQFRTFGIQSHSNEWLIGIRVYTGAGTLIDRHRNGTLNSFLTSAVF